MRPHEVLSLLEMRKPSRSRIARVLARSFTVEDFHREAIKRWPRGVRDYVDGGADGELSLGRNRRAFADFDLVPSILRDVSSVDLSSTILGDESALPFLLAPTGYTRMMHTDGERAVARAARAASIPYAMATMATVPIEEIATSIGGDLWFQLYVWRDRVLVQDLLDRAAANGYHKLILTVDTAVTGMRVRDMHNGFTLPPRLTPTSIMGIAAHPVWCISMLRGESVTFANFATDVSGSSQTVMEFAAQQFDSTVTWRDVEDIRALWPGYLIIKGILNPADAQHAAAVGADAVILSNHGGRQLDRARSPLDALAEVRDRVGADLQILLDSGIRHGSDLAIALACGADACLIGRPYLYGLGAAGEAGVSAVIAILRDELRRVMQLLGVASIAQLRAEGPVAVRRRQHPASQHLGSANIHVN